MHKVLTAALSVLFVFALPSFADIDTVYAAESADKATDKKGGGKKEAEPDCD